MTRWRYLLWNLVTNTFPFAQITLAIVLVVLFIEFVLKPDRNPKPTTE